MSLEKQAKTITEWLYQNNPERASILLEIQRKLGWKEEQKLVTLEVAQKLEEQRNESMNESVSLSKKLCQSEAKIADVNNIIDEKLRDQERNRVPIDYKITFHGVEIRRLREALK
jgi:hypothetical protein